MTVRSKAAVLVASLALLAGVSAPAAIARPRGPSCNEAGVKTVCQTNGSVSIKARPGTTAPPANMPVFPWLGMPGGR